jgi:nucleotide-binding universal stress UspA family protein
MADTRIIVGYDGSHGARAALAWAMDEGVRRGLPVQLLHVVGADGPAEGDALRHETAELTRLAADLDDWGTLGIAVTARVVEGPVAHALCEESEGAALLVVGDRGLGGFTGLRVGSVSLTAATYARCPVVVIRGEVCVGTSRPVVVGTDGSPQGELALQHAFAEAATRAVGLTVVRAGLSPDDDATVAERELLDEIASIRRRYPHVAVSTRLTQVTAAHALTVASHDGQLIVVGTRGRGGFDGLVLGSVAQQLLHHSLCPVMVVRATAGPPLAVQANARREALQPGA